MKDKRKIQQVKLEQNKKMLKSQRQDLKQNKGKSKKIKEGYLILFLEKNQKDILSKIPFSILDS